MAFIKQTIKMRRKETAQKELVETFYNKICTLVELLAYSDISVVDISLDIKNVELSYGETAVVVVEGIAEDESFATAQICFLDEIVDMEWMKELAEKLQKEGFVFSQCGYSGLKEHPLKPSKIYFEATICLN